MNRTRRWLSFVAAALPLVGACAKDAAPTAASQEAAPMAPGAKADAFAREEEADKESAKSRRATNRAARMVAKKSSPAALGALGGEGGGGSRPVEAPAFEIAGATAPEAAAPADEAPATREWFPESFLFEPRLITDATGRASLDVKVPDRLTTWRVLALAHTRSGEQAGAVTSFLGTLPLYVEPVVPRALVAGDVVRVPIQLVNTTEAAASRRLAVSVEGGGLEGATGREVKVPAGGSAVEVVTVRATQPGSLVLAATLAGADSIRRTVSVVPRGRRVIVERTGTLAAPRARDIEAPRGEFSSASLEVSPGALAVLRSELATAGGRGGAADVAYALMLAGEAPRLLPKLGGEVDLDALRTLRIVATQRALRYARAPSPEVAALLVEAAYAHPDQPVLSRLAQRLSAAVAGWQRPDGTFGGATGWTLRRVLVSTAEGLRSAQAEARALEALGGDADPARLARARSRAEATRIRASAAVERNLGRIDDPYTAAMLVASGAAQGSVAEALRAKIREAVQVGEDGARTLALPKEAVRADGVAPSAVEAAAVAVLALAGDPEAPWVPDLAATVLGGYQPGAGFGDGRASLWALRAVLATFSAPLPSSVEITLELDGKPLTRGTFDAAQLRDVLHLTAPVAAASGTHRWGVRAEPAVPGLGYRLALTTWVPVTPEPEAGVALQIRAHGDPKVGRPTEVTLIASAPAGYPLSIIHRLPAGVVPDDASLAALVSAGSITRYDTEDGAVRLEVPPLSPSTPWQAAYKVVPTLGGSLQSGASTIEVAGETRTLVPTTWVVR